MEAKYNLKHAKEILEPCGLLGENQRGKYLRIKKRGVMPAIKRDLLLQTETEGLRWRPARQLQLLPGAPEVKGTPMLPNPFTARELAAFMLEGAGALVADFYGEWDDGPDPESLRAIDPDSKARRAVTEAFTAYRLAIEKVGKYDMDALARRDAAHTAYWKSSNDKALLKAFEDAEAEWDAAYQAWLTKMVRCLLEPQAAAPAPVADESESNAPLQKAKAKRRTWKDVSASYIVEVMRAGRYTTAKELYRALESKAGANSPFDKGTGDNRGSLFVRDIAESLSLKTVQNNWQSLREQAKK